VGTSNYWDLSGLERAIDVLTFTNLLPAYTILFLAIGLLESDRLFILFGYAMTTATTIFFASITGTIWQLVNHWLHIAILNENLD
jgi:hypothetical protein